MRLPRRNCGHLSVWGSVIVVQLIPHACGGMQQSKEGKAREAKEAADDRNRQAAIIRESAGRRLVRQEELKEIEACASGRAQKERAYSESR